MSTLTTLNSELKNRLQDAAHAVWTDAELLGYLEQAVKSLYPHWYLFANGTTTATIGPLQTAPAGARNLHYIGLNNGTSNRARVIRGWQEGSGQAIVPKLNITGQTLIWAWTVPHAADAASPATTLTIPAQAEEVVVLRAQITALERVLTDRVKKAKYFAQQVREGVTESEIATTLDALHASVDTRMKDAPGPPQRVG